MGLGRIIRSEFSMNERRLSMRLFRNGNRRKRFFSTALVAMLTTSLAVSGPVASVHADTSVGGNSAVMLTAEQTIPTIEINKYGLTDGAIKVDFTQNGSYTLTGSNLVEGKRIDATFTVPSGKEVDIYLEGVDIYNGYYLSAGCSSEEAKPVFIINGTANIHVSSNSSITGLCEMFRVNGVLNFIGSTGEATLTVNRSIYGDFYGTYPMISGDKGEVHYKGARVTFVNKVNGGDGDPVPCKGYTYIDCDVVPQTQGGPVEFEFVYLTAYQVPGMDSLKLKGDNSILHDIYGQEVSKSTIEGLPAGGEVVQLVTLDGNNAKNPIPATRRAVSNLRADSEGKLENVYLPAYFDIYVKSGDTVQCYPKTSKNNSSVTGQPAYTVNFVDKNNTTVSMGSYWVKKGDKVTLLEENGNYNYTSYTLEDESKVTAETTISTDTTIYVTKTQKPEVTITVDGSSMQIEYGATLASAHLVGTYACKETKSMVDLANTTVTATIHLMKVDLDTEVRDGETWFKISSAEELDTFAKLVTVYGITNINGCLINDIDSYNGTMIGSYVLKEDNYGIDFDKSNFFKGSFDGAGHTVNLEYDSDNTTLAGLFGSVSAGAEIKNVITTGSVNGNARFTGALVASVICQNGDAVKIDNCINKANVSITRNENEYLGGLVGGKYVDYSSGSGTQVMELSITNCVNTGQVLRGSGIIGECMGSSETIISGCINYSKNLPITTSKSAYVKVSNSYSTYVDESLPIGTLADEKAFKSGEVEYLLNLGGSTRTWYQKIGVDDYPKTNGDSATETVYRGYASCEATTPIYSNTEIAHKEQGHKAGTTYSYAGGKISAGCCIYCQEDVSASITLPTEYLGDQKGAKANANSLWTELGCPNITFGYAAEKGGDYSSVLPTKEGQWYVRAYVGGQNIDIDGTYTIKKRPTTPVNPDGGSGTTGGGSGTTGGSGESGDPQNPSDDEKTSDKDGETGKDDKSGETDKTGKDGEGAQSPAVEKKVEKLSKQYGEDVQVVGTTSMVAEAVSASKKGGVFVTSSGDIAKSTFVSGKNGKTYFTNEAGKPVKSSLVTDGSNTYYCGKSGAVAYNKPVTLPDGTRVLASESGAIITKANAKVTVNGKSYLTVKGGVLASKEIVTTKSGKLYYADKYGVVVVNKTVKVDGVKYKASKTGVLKIVK